MVVSAASSLVCRRWTLCVDDLQFPEADTPGASCRTRKPGHEGLSGMSSSRNVWQCRLQNTSSLTYRLPLGSPVLGRSGTGASHSTAGLRILCENLSANDAASQTDGYFISHGQITSCWEILGSGASRPTAGLCMPPQKSYPPPATCPAGAGPGAGPAAGPAAGPGAARGGITAERRYQGRSPKPPPVWAGSRLSKGLGVAEMAFSLFQSMVLFRVFRSVCHGRLWSPNQSYLQTAQLDASPSAYTRFLFLHPKQVGRSARTIGKCLCSCRHISSVIKSVMIWRI